MADVLLSIGIDSTEAIIGRNAFLGAGNDIAREYARLINMADDYARAIRGIPTPPVPPPLPGPAGGGAPTIDALANAYRRVVSSVDEAYAAQLRYDNALAALRAGAAAAGASASELAAREAQLAAAMSPAAIAARQAAEENARLAIAYQNVVSKIDPSVAAQVKYDKALADLRAGAAAAGVSITELAAREAQLAAAMSPAAIEAKKQETAVRALLSAYTPLAAEIQRLRHDETELTRLHAAGALTTDQHAAAVSALRTRLAQATDEHTRMGNGARFNASQMANLSYQINDVVSGLAMGQSPMMILTQQGGQFVQIFQQAGFALGEMAMKAAPIAGIAAGFLVVGSSVNNIIDQMHELDRAMLATGSASGVSFGQIAAMADQVAAKTMQSTSAVRDMMISTTAAGINSANTIARISMMARDMGDVMGKSAEDGQAELIKMAKNIPAAVDAISASYRNLTYEERRHIQALVDSGDKMAAQEILLSKLDDNIVGAGANVGFFTAAWRGLIGAIGTGVDTIGKGFVQAGKNIKDMATQNVVLKDSELGLSMAFAQAQAQRNAAMRAQFQDTAKAAQDAFKAIDSSDQLQQLTDRANGFAKALASGVVAQGTEGYKKLALSVEAANTAYQTFLDPGQKALALAEAAAQAVDMETNEREAFLAIRQKEIELSGQYMTTQQREQQLQAVAIQQMVARKKAIKEAVDAQQKERDAITATIGAIKEELDAREVYGAVLAATKAKGEALTDAEIMNIRKTTQERKAAEAVAELLLKQGEVKLAESLGLQFQQLEADYQLRKKAAQGNAEATLAVEKWHSAEYDKLLKTNAATTANTANDNAKIQGDAAARAGQSIATNMTSGYNAAASASTQAANTQISNFNSVVAAAQSAAQKLRDSIGAAAIYNNTTSASQDVALTVADNKAARLAEAQARASTMDSSFAASYLADVQREVASYNAKGNIFSAGNVVPFALGGLPSGQDIFSTPTYFPMAGGKVGLTGENGTTDALMPVTRDSKGRLAVTAVGGEGGGAVNLTVNVGDIVVSGADSPQRTAEEIARQIAPLIGRELERYQRTSGDKRVMLRGAGRV